jgi:hypothetical protein
MVGLGETDEEILEVMRDLRAHDVEMLTIGQYLQPSGGHLPVLRYVHPDTLRCSRREGEAMGFKHAACGPMVRSSYHADRQAHAAGSASSDTRSLPEAASISDSKDIISSMASASATQISAPPAVCSDSWLSREVISCVVALPMEQRGSLPCAALDDPVEHRNIDWVAIGGKDDGVARAQFENAQQFG